MTQQTGTSRLARAAVFTYGAVAYVIFFATFWNGIVGVFAKSMETGDELVTAFLRRATGALPADP